MDTSLKSEMDPHYQKLAMELGEYKEREKDRFEEFLRKKEANNGRSEISEQSKELQELMKLLVTKETKGINLNKLNIPVFNSKPENWRSYREIVNIMMNDMSINSTRKLLALKQSTEGKAHKLIMNINYGVDADKRAFNLLINRFDNPRKMMNNELAQLFSKEKHNNVTRNVKMLLNCSLNVFSNLEGILRENEDGVASREGRISKTFTVKEIKEKIADVVFNYGIEARFNLPTALAYSDFLEKKTK